MIPEFIRHVVVYSAEDDVEKTDEDFSERNVSA